MNFEPLKNRVAVKRDTREEKTLTSGVIIPESAQQLPQQGTIMAVGPEVKDLAVGNRVIFGISEGQQHTIDGEEVRIMREDKIWAVLS